MTGHETPLPGVLDEIAAIVGRQAALHLALALGGETLHIPDPAHMTADHALVKAAGGQPARTIAGHFRGDSLYIPMARRALVRHLSGCGLATAEIARRLGINKHTVRQYRRGG